MNMTMDEWGKKKKRDGSNEKKERTDNATDRSTAGIKISWVPIT